MSSLTGGGQTIGYKYYIGMHQILCQSPVDHVLAIKWQDNIGWEGTVNHGPIQINRPDLFGGAKKEGGVSGQVDVLSGDAAQGVNDYLALVHGAQSPAYRGVLSLVFRQMYIGNNPFLKPISYKVKNVQSTFGGWLPDLAAINGEMQFEKASIYIALDYSGSMAGAAAANQAASIKGFIAGLKGHANDIKIVAYNMAVVGQIERFGCSDSDYDDIIAWVDTLPAPNTGTDYEVAVSLAGAFFDAAGVAAANAGAQISSWSSPSGLISSPDGVGDASGNIETRKILIFLTDGFPSFPVSATNAVVLLDAIQGLERFAFNINSSDTTYTSLIDNTSIDGVPVVSTADPDSIQRALTAAIGSWVDINPAHILRDLIVSPTSGGNGDEAAIGPSFAEAAATLHAEGFGLSLHHENPADAESFKKIVERHIDGLVYNDRATGLWGLKLIRNDYQIADLFVFDASNVVEFIDLITPLQEDLPNQISLTYTKRPLGEKASLTVSNVAAIQMLGNVIPEVVEYEGVTQPALAARLAARDLVALTVPMATGAIRATHAPLSLNIGSPIIIHEPRLGFLHMICRVVDIEEGGGRDNSVLIRFVQDRFSSEIDSAEFFGDPVALDVDRSVKPPNVSFIEEAPYWVAAVERGQTEVDNILVDDPDAGYFLGACDKPSNFHIDADIGMNLVDGWAAKATTDFAPAAPLVEDLSYRADFVELKVEYNDSLLTVAAGDLFSVGGEIMRVDAMTVAGGVATITAGRGCLDTVPSAHLTGYWAVFWNGHTASDNVQYTGGDALEIALFPKTNTDILPIAQALPQTVLMSSRAHRPYPPGKLQLNGAYADALAVGPITVSWAHRDRKIQTTAIVDDHTADNIGPEVGVSYTFRAALVDAAGAELIVFVDDQDLGISTSVIFDLDDYQFNFFLPSEYFNRDDYFGSVLPDAGVAVRFSVGSTRGAIDCWQVPHLDAAIFLPPSGLTLSSPDEITFLPPAGLTLMEI